MTDPINSMDVGQTEYMKLFMQELTYQDPLKPLDNREFMTQMAQFSALQQAISTGNDVKQLLDATNANQAVNLLGKNIQIAGVEGFLNVQAVSFNQNNKVELRAKTNQGEYLFVGLEQITKIEA